LFSFIRAYHIITLIGVLQKWLNVKGLLHQNEAETKCMLFLNLIVSQFYIILLKRATIG